MLYLKNNGPHKKPYPKKSGGMAKVTEEIRATGPCLIGLKRLRPGRTGWRKLNTNSGTIAKRDKSTDEERIPINPEGRRVFWMSEAKYAPRIIQEKELTWVPLSVIAREFNRDTETIRQWAVNGLLLEIGYSVRKDFVGYWVVGVPNEQFSRFSRTSYQPVVNQIQTL
jgi:hypothetical protein